MTQRDRDQMREPLHVDWCDHAAAKYAVDNWHYSEAMPAGKNQYFGVWEHHQFIGAVIYGGGSTPHIADPFPCDRTEIVELLRVALDDHETPVTQILSITLSMLERRNDTLRFVISFADPKEDHVGTIYQAANWYYLGQQPPARYIRINGTVYHPRSLNQRYGTSSITKLRDGFPDTTTVEPEPRPGKHKYAYPLDDDARTTLESLGSKDYPSEP